MCLRSYGRFGLITRIISKMASFNEYIKNRTANLKSNWDSYKIWRGKWPQTWFYQCHCCIHWPSCSSRSFLGSITTILPLTSFYFCSSIYCFPPYNRIICPCGGFLHAIAETSVKKTNKLYAANTVKEIQATPLAEYWKNIYKRIFRI